MEFEFMSADTVLPPCMPLPAAMLRLPISSTAKVMYARLLNTTLTAGIEAVSYTHLLSMMRTEGLWWMEMHIFLADLL